MRRVVLVAVLALVAHTANAQWVNFRAPGAPRLPDGRPNLAAPLPRSSDGRPDLSGVWHVQPTSREEMKRLFGPTVDEIEVPGMEIDTVSKYGVNILQDFKPQDVPMKPAALAVMKQRRPELFPPTFCLPAGIPVSTMLSEVSKIVQAPGLIVVMLELGGTRQIYTDGRNHMPDNSPSWLGYSVGRWEGDTLVVETIGFNGKSWLDIIGHPQSEQAKLTDRYRRRDFGHMDIELTIDDPKAYTKPWKAQLHPELVPDTELIEMVCMENERDLKHLVGK